MYNILFLLDCACQIFGSFRRVTKAVVLPHLGRFWIELVNLKYIYTMQTKMCYLLHEQFMNSPAVPHKKVFVSVHENIPASMLQSFFVHCTVTYVCFYCTCVTFRPTRNQFMTYVVYKVSKYALQDNDFDLAPYLKSFCEP